MPRSPSLPPSARVTGMALALFLAALPLPRAANAIANCLGGTCTACNPTIPGAVAALIPSGSFTDGAANEPVKFIDPADGSRRRFVVTQEGAILIWDGGSGALLATPFLDLRDDGGGPGLDKVLYGGERGLLSMAVEPDYATSGRFYVYYTRDPDGDIVVERYQRSAGNPNLADPTGTMIFRIDHSATNHNGGDLAFGPDDYLYVSTGDGGGGCDSGAGINGDGQQPGTLLGKILRVDVMGVDPTPAAVECGLDPGAYAVPSDNPYVGLANACNETWVLGLRNPFRISFDRLTGDLYLGDVGQDNWEEIDLRPAATSVSTAVNFGWVCREGCDNSSTPPSNCSTAGCPVDPGTTCAYPARPSGFVDPILCHSNPGGWSSIMGGFRYRGALVPALAGRYFYSDAGAGQIWVTTSLDPANPGATTACCWDTGNGGVYGFAEDHLGELYVVNGGAHRIDCVHDGHPDGCFWAGWGGLFEDGFESEDTSHWSSTSP